MPLVLGGSAVIPAAYSIDNSCRWNDGDSPYMHYTPGSTTSQVKWTYSLWVKLGDMASRECLLWASSDGGSSDYVEIQFKADRTLNFQVKGASGTTPGVLETTRLFRDCSAWYHLVFVWDSENASAGDRMKIYVNGTEETVFNTDNNPADGDLSPVLTSGVETDVGKQTGTTHYFDGYLSEVALIDGQAYSASDFGEFNSDSPTIWQPKDISGLTFGTSGFWLDFGDSAALGDDVSGVGNDLTVVNIVALDQAVDSPTNNFAIFNVLGSNSDSISDGNLYASQRAATDYSGGCATTIGVKKGKWYCEWKCVNVGAQTEFGIHKGNTFLSVAGDFEYGAGALYYGSAGLKYIAGSSDGAYGDSWTSGNIISIALDMDNRDVYFYKDGVIQNSGTAAFDSSDIADGTYYFPFAAGYNVSLIEGNFGGCNLSAITSGNADANGYGNFEYAVPTDYYAICTKNLDEFGG